MLSLRLVRRFRGVPNIAARTVALSSEGKACPGRGSARKPVVLDEPALVKLKKERDPDKLFNLFMANASNMVVVENRYAYEDTISRLAGARRFDYIEQMLEHQKSLPQGRREGFMIRVIMLYGMAGMTKHAVNTFCDMHLYGSKRTVKSFNATLKVLTQSRDFKEVERFLSDISSRYEINFDIYSVNIAMKAFCEMGALEKASLFLVGMEKAGIAPDVVTYTTLIAAFYKDNHPEIANGLWNLMVSKGCLPNVATFNARIHFLVSKGRAWKANEMLAFMQHHKKSHFCPDEITYNLVIKGFCRARLFDMAMRVYSALHGEGYKANQKIFHTIIHYMCLSGNIELAYAMCKRSMQKKLFPSTITICRLLEALKKDGKPDKIRKAFFIYNLALERIPSFSVADIETMKAILKKTN